MVEEFWNELMGKLFPNVTIFPWYENNNIIKTLPIFIDWKKYPQHLKFDNQSEIIPLLEKLLKHPPEDMVYVYAPYDLFSIIKAPLSTLIANYESIPKSDYVWLWNPTEGYVIEDDAFGNCIVGLIEPSRDPYPHIELRKAFFSRNKFRFDYSFRDTIECFGLKLINDDTYIDEANKILTSFQAVCPLTISGEIDWDKIKKKTVLGNDQTRIISELKKLVGQQIIKTAYIEWYNDGIPLVQIDLQKIITDFNQLVPSTHATIIFDSAMSYVIEITQAGDIVLGSIEKLNNTVDTQYLPKKNTNNPNFLLPGTSIHNLLKTAGLEIIVDSDADKILADLQNKIPFTPWGNIDWDKFKKKVVVGKDRKNALPTLRKIINKPFDTKIYATLKESEFPLVRINFDDQTADYWPIWSNAYGALLFNINERYVVEINVLKEITVGVL